jgi:hypothetical protein
VCSVVWYSSLPLLIATPYKLLIRRNKNHSSLKTCLKLPTIISLSMYEMHQGSGEDLPTLHVLHKGDGHCFTFYIISCYGCTPDDDRLSGWNSKVVCKCDCFATVIFVNIIISTTACPSINRTNLLVAADKSSSEMGSNWARNGRWILPISISVIPEGIFNKPSGLLPLRRKSW